MQNMLLAAQGKGPGEAALARFQVKEILTASVKTCRDESLTPASHGMILVDIHRILVHGQLDEEIVGALFLSDTARMPWGSCRACMASRIQVEESF